MSGNQQKLCVSLSLSSSSTNTIRNRSRRMLSKTWLFQMPYQHQAKFSSALTLLLDFLKTSQTLMGPEQQWTLLESWHYSMLSLWSHSQRSALFLLLNKCLLYNEIPCYCYEILIFRIFLSLTVMYIGRSSI